jgi:hypothetical protein
MLTIAFGLASAYLCGNEFVSYGSNCHETVVFFNRLLHFPVIFLRKKEKKRINLVIVRNFHVQTMLPMTA